MAKENTEATTKPLNFWDDKFWHHLVHQRLGEILHYYVVRIRPFDPNEVENCLRKLIQEQRLGSVRVFPIFGSYDLVIRAWLYPSVADRFRKELDLGLANVGGSWVVHTFSVEHIDQRWHGKEKVDRDLLEGLDEASIRSVQLGEAPSLFSQLVTGNLAFRRRKTESIRFFMTVNIESLVDALPLGVVNAIKHDLNSTHSIENVSIYRGFGFCQILVKGEVLNYFNIAPLPTWIGTAYKPYAAHTETYLVHGPSNILGDESIGEATFFALRGKDLFVQSILPEIYDHLFKKQRVVERFLTDEVHKYVPSSKDKKLLHDYLYAFLNDDGSSMAKTLLIFFYDLESYLGKNHKAFIASQTGKTAKEVFQMAHLDDEALKRPSLRHIFLVCALAVREKGEAMQDKGVTASWDELVDLRNDVIHGKTDPLVEWNTLLRRLVPHLSRIRELLHTVEKTSTIQCTGDYF